MHTSLLRRYIGLAFVLIALAVGVNACTVITTETQTTALARANGWKFDSFPVGTPTADVRTAYTGSTMKFTSNGAWTLTTASQLAGSWSWASLTTLALTFSGATDTWEVVELSATTMRWSAQVSGATLEMRWTAVQ